MPRLRVPCLLASDLASEARYQPRVNHARPVLRPVQPLNSALPGAGMGTDRPDRSADKRVCRTSNHDEGRLSLNVTVTVNAIH